MKKRSRLAQVSVEYLFVVGFTTLLTIPLLIIYFNYSNEAADSVATSQALQVARKIVDASESVYYLGKPSQTTLKLAFPDRIAAASLENNEVLFQIRVKGGTTDIVFPSSVNITGTLPTTQGHYTVTLKAETNYVTLTAE